MNVSKDGISSFCSDEILHSLFDFVFNVFALLLPTIFRWIRVTFFQLNSSVENSLISSFIELKAFSVAGMSAIYSSPLSACVKIEWENRFWLACFVSSLSILILTVLPTAFLKKNFFLLCHSLHLSNFHQYHVF